MVVEERGDLRLHERMKPRLERAPRRRVGEDDLREATALLRRHQPMHDVVGVDRRNPQLAKKASHKRLAAGDSAREGNARHIVSSRPCG